MRNDKKYTSRSDPTLSSTVDRKRRPYGAARKLEVARVRKAGACPECRRRKVSCRHALQPTFSQISSNPASSQMTPANLVQGKPVAADHASANFDENTTLIPEYETLLQRPRVQEYGPFLCGTAPQVSSDQSEISSLNRVLKHRDITETKLDGDLLSNTQAFWITTEPFIHSTAASDGDTFSAIPNEDMQKMGNGLLENTRCQSSTPLLDNGYFISQKASGTDMPQFADFEVAIRKNGEDALISNDCSISGEGDYPQLDFGQLDAVLQDDFFKLWTGELGGSEEVDTSEEIGVSNDVMSMMDSDWISYI
ncbi:hypothetical protein EG329_005554 [Mollisiaceae sp. DMI_Dod_QoI]|nr:hypothetical protein EG329_005554 [Helotiales sp. DMI_Dod_QoI]